MVFHLVAGVGLEAAATLGHYATAQGQTGATLRVALHDILKGQP